MNIGEASKATGISVKMLRYYEEISLVRPALRANSGYRVYGEKDIQRLRFVRRARDLGFSVKQIEALLDLWNNQGRTSGDVKALAMAHVAEMEQRKSELQEMIDTLHQLARHCHGDHRPDCPILKDLGAITEPVEAPRTRAKTRPGFAART
jgi:Cu(I)-responsive transcriptional regulator